MYQQTILFVVQILSLVFLIIYVVKTWEMASATRKAAEATGKSVREMWEARDNESAPYVVAYLEVDNDLRQLYLIIKNSGRSIARDVHIIFEPPLATRYADLLARVIPAEGIPSIPPNYEIKTIIDHFPQYVERDEPMVYKTTVTYFGGLSNNQRSSEHITNLMLYRGIVYTLEHNYLGDLARDVREIARAQGNLVQVIAALRECDSDEDND